MLEDQTIEAPRERDTANRTNEVQAERARAVAVTQRVEHTGCRNDTTANSGSITALLPIMGVVLVAFLVIGIALPVLPLHVHQGLGLSTFVVGLVTGSQFAASLISRVWSGHYADSKGAKRAVVVGLLTAVAGGLLYLLSLAFLATPPLSAAILLGGRALLGVAESFVITGAVSWGLALAGPANTGRVIAWVGMAMFAALAVGAPIGTTLYALGGFTAVAVATIVFPLATVLLVIPLRSVAVQRGSQSGLLKVLGSVWLPGFGSALSTMGFGAMIAFSSLLSAERGWSPVWLSFSAFAIALVAARLFFGHTPDRLGGAKVALVSVFVEAAGLGLIWFASTAVLAAAGAALTGFGYALVYPGLGVEAVRRVPPQSRGLAMGAYTVFLDVALGFGSPVLGLIADWTGLSSVFLVSAIIVLGAAGVAAWLLHSSRRSAHKRQTQEIIVKFIAMTLASLSMLASSVAQADPKARDEVRAVAPALEKYRQDTLFGDLWKRPGLSPRDRSIVTLAALITRNQTAEMAQYLNFALDNGVKPSELSEIITHLAFYAGWGNSMAAVTIANDVFAARKITADQLSPASPKLLALNEAAEADRAKRVGELFGEVFPGVTQYTTDVLFRDLWLRPALAPRDRSLVTISSLVASGQVAQLNGHVPIGMNNGLTQVEIAEALTHLTFYVGWPNVFSAMPVAKDVFEKRAR